MNADELKRRQGLTFAQAEGTVPLPRQLKLREVSPQLRAMLWKIIFSSMEGFYGQLTGPWDRILMDYHADILHGMADKFTKSQKAWIEKLGTLFEKGKYDEVLTFVQFLAQHYLVDGIVKAQLALILEDSRAAYRFLGDPPTLVPISDEITAKSTATALEAVKRTPAARMHLMKAVEELNGGNYRDSIRESIHAVESIAKTIAADASATLKPALDKISSSHPIHPALKSAFGQLYGYTSDEKGIRHALTENAADNVGEREAMFMFTSCAAFCAYLVTFAATK